MREILFRGRRVDNEEWVEGSLFQRKKGCTEIFDHKETLFAGRMIEGMWRKVDQSTVGQYIGIKDKNGKRIFEGDIVRTKYGRVCKIVWHGYTPVFDLTPISNYDSKAPDKYDLFYPENLEVIGNIYNECCLACNEIED